MKTWLFLFCFLLTGFAWVSAQEYYADVVMDIGESGTVFIHGTTNHPALSVAKSDEFTSKQGKYWVFSADLNGVFSDYVFSVKLPARASINYLKAQTPVQIFSDGSRVVVSGVGRNEPFSLKIQYSFQEKKSRVFSIPFFVFLVSSITLVFGLLVFFLKKKSLRPAGFDSTVLTERQLSILKIVEKHGVVSQKEIETALGIPKSSVSRNVNALVRKGVLKKEQKGMTNLILLPEPK